MKIVIDAMGGDHAPLEIVRGALQAADQQEVNIILTGRGQELLACLDELGLRNLPERVEMGDATEVVTMEDDPISAARAKRDSSMNVALKMLRDGAADAMISAGNTGALLTGATMLLKRLKGVRRAALAPVLPGMEGGVLLIDSGANVECSPEYLVQFARMGAVYARKAMRIPEPRVGLLNIGAEPKKGTALHREAYALLCAERDAGRLRFVGNMEARTALMGGCDVLAADGMTGNIMLKSMEGMGLLFLKELDDAVYRDGRLRLAGRLLREELELMRHRYDETEIGGTVLLGLTKPVVKAHGSADARAIQSAVSQAVRLVKSGITEQIAGEMARMARESGEAYET